MKTEKLVVNVLTNLILFVAISCVACVSFYGGVSNVVALTDKNQPYFRGNEACKQVSIMINVYWGTEYLDATLDILDKYNVKATFFVGGDWVSKNSDVLSKIALKQHEIGNHGYFHKSHDKLSYQQNVDEIVACQKVVESVCGVKTTLFAPPSGAYSKNTLNAAASLGYKTIMWSKDTIDWRDKDTNLIYSRATKNLSNGDLVLMHPTKNTVEALPKIIKYYIDAGFEIVTVGKNLSGDTNAIL